MFFYGQCMWKKGFWHSQVLINNFCHFIRELRTPVNLPFHQIFKKLAFS
jgi:hypothetical protein